MPQDPALTDQVHELVRQAMWWGADDESAQNALAWFLATCPQPGFRDPDRAVELAKRLIKQNAYRPAHWRTLGRGVPPLAEREGSRSRDGTTLFLGQGRPFPCMAVLFEQKAGAYLDALSRIALGWRHNHQGQLIVRVRWL